MKLRGTMAKLEWGAETRTVEEKRQMEKRAIELALMNWIKWYLRFPVQEYCIIPYILQDNKVKERYG